MARVRPIGTIVQSRRYRLSCEGCPRPELRLRKVSPIQVPAFRPGTSVIGHIKRTPAGVPLGSRETEKQDPFLGAKVVATSVAGLIAVEKFEDGRSRLDCDWSSSTEEVRTLREVLDSRSPPTVPESWYEWRARCVVSTFRCGTDACGRWWNHGVGRHRAMHSASSQDHYSSARRHVV